MQNVGGWVNHLNDICFKYSKPSSDILVAFYALITKRWGHIALPLSIYPYVHPSLNVCVSHIYSKSICITNL